MDLEMLLFPGDVQQMGFVTVAPGLRGPLLYSSIQGSAVDGGGAGSQSLSLGCYRH